MTSKNDQIPNSSGSLRKPSLLTAGSKSVEDQKTRHDSGSKTSLSAVKWHSAPATEREDGRSSSSASKSTSAAIEMSAAGGGGGGGWRPLQRQKVVTAAPTLEEDEDGRPASVAAAADADRSPRKRSLAVRRGYSCQEPCAARRPMTMNSCGCVAVGGVGGAITAAGENRRRWLSADTGGNGHAVAGTSRSMECLPSPQPPSTPHHLHRSSFIMAADDRKSLDSGLDDVAATAAAAEMADRRRGMFASTRTSVPSHLSLALPSCERRLTILSPHTHTPSTPFYSTSSTETAWHFCTSSTTAAMSSSTSFASHSTASTSAVTSTCRPRKKNQPGMVLPRLVLPGSSDLDIFSQ
ncbi:unnamed protein product [Macrosiphum euphorbiae]|uniref:Uncharacterized protein n=1 Tax=Macrosiphum euphorbiae TaxID=13131 RepID=A0AAV0XNW3_9HEMI|nr:unnamed protein product [Macrosiphum euphorbiae]